MDTKKFLDNVINDVRIELTDEFDRNFERKGFFDKKWKRSKFGSGGSVLTNSGNLRRSIRSQYNGSALSFSSSLPYASIHNEGGEIIVTQRMKRFFWAMHLKASNASRGGKQRAERMNEEAKKWKALALKKVGSKIIIPQRQFIGWHPSLKKSIQNIVDINLEQYADSIKNDLKK